VKLDGPLGVSKFKGFRFRSGFSLILIFDFSSAERFGGGPIFDL